MTTSGLVAVNCDGRRAASCHIGVEVRESQAIEGLNTMRPPAA
jgi:hypothetical protein